MDTMQLKKDEDGKVMQVVTTEVTQEVALSSEELIRQIKEHSAIVNTLQAQLEAVKAFEESEDSESEVEVNVSTTPLIDQTKLDSISEARSK